MGGPRWAHVRFVAPPATTFDIGAQAPGRGARGSPGGGPGPGWLTLTGLRNFRNHILTFHDNKSGHASVEIPDRALRDTRLCPALCRRGGLSAHH